MANLFKSLSSFFENPQEDAITPEESIPMNILHILMDQSIRDLEHEIEREKILQKQAAQAAAKAAESGDPFFVPRTPYSISAIKDIEEVCSSIFRMSNHYITHTNNMVARRGETKLLKHMLDEEGQRHVKRRDKFQIQMVPPHEYNDIISNRIPPEVINILAQIKNTFDSEKLFPKLAPINPGFARKLQLLYLISSKKVK